MIIRKYEQSDFIKMTDFEFWRGGLLQNAKYITYDDGVICLVAEIDGDIIGYICGENTYMCGNILFATEVREEYRKQGVFKTLLAEYEKLANTAITVVHNAQLNDFYSKVGFTVGDNLRASVKEV